MVLPTHFQKFDLLADVVPKRPFPNLPDIAQRARSFLSGRTAEQIESIANRINTETEYYFNDLRDQAIDELTVKFQNEPEAYEEFFQWDGGTLDKGRWLYRKDMDEELDIPTAQNTSDVDALKTIIENRDDFSVLPDGAPIPEPDHWVEGKTHELFAVLSLTLVGHSIAVMSHGEGSRELSIAGAYVVQAMDAVCFAERVREVEWLEQFHKKQILQASSSQDVQRQCLEADTRRELAAEFLAHEHEKQLIRTDRLNAARHKTTNEAKDLVCAKWEKATNAFPSAEKAGNFYADWLEDERIGYLLKGKQVFFQPRAVTGWIRAHARKKGIKFR